MPALPPFRADQVGSLLRPAALAQLRARHKQGEVDAATLRRAEDDAVRDAVRHQESIGLQAVTDGEFRRDWWHLDFLAQLDGVTLKHNAGEKFKVAGQEQPPWLGDTSVWAAADALAPLTARDDDGARRITAEGEAVLAGHARRPAHDHWVGGVHLVPGEPGWAWDARAGEPVRTS